MKLDVVNPSEENRKTQLHFNKLSNILRELKEISVAINPLKGESQSTMNSLDDVSSLTNIVADEERKLHEVPFKISYNQNVSNVLTVYSPLTFEILTSILKDHGSIKFAFFHSGIEKCLTRYDFNDRIYLQNVRKITIELPDQNINFQNGNPNSSSVIAPEYIRLFHFLKEVDFEDLQRIRIICKPEIALSSIPLQAAFVPCYEVEDFHPLIQLIRKNKETLLSISVGETMGECFIKMNPKACTKICEPKNYPRIESFEGFSNFPILPSWSALLRPQKHLNKLKVSFSHAEVWNDVCKAIEKSGDFDLKTIGITLKPIDGEVVSLDLKILRSCNGLRDFSISYEGSNVIGWGFLPEGITNLTISGPLSLSNVEILTLTLLHLEDVTIFLQPKDNNNVENGDNESPAPVDIVKHPAFHFITSAPKSLKLFNLESNDVPLNWDSLHKAINAQKEFTLVEKLEDFSLIREVSPDDPTVPAIAANEEDNNKEDMELSLFGSCMSAITWRNRYV